MDLLIVLADLTTIPLPRAIYDTFRAWLGFVY